VTDHATPAGDRVVQESVYRASAALPAAGAYTTATRAAVLPSARLVTLVTAYTKGGATGAFAMRVLWYLQGQEQTPVTQTHVNESDATVEVSPLVLQGETVSGTSAVRRAVTLEPPAGVVAVGVEAAETGTTATPGTLEIRLVVEGE
jgi:hypothetical protein